MLTFCSDLIHFMGVTECTVTLATSSLQTLVLEHHAMTRKLTTMQKGIYAKTYNPTHLTKVTHISSILKFLNTESLVLQVSNTRFNI